MLSIAVCDDDILDGCNIIKMVKSIMEARRIIQGGAGKEAGIRERIDGITAAVI